MSIPPSVIRRVNRVRARIDPRSEEPDEILDDIFVLCRAFEATWSAVGGEGQQAQEAVVATIAANGIGALPAVRQLVEALRAFVSVSNMECAEWFGSDYATPSETKARYVSLIRRLREAVAADAWTDRDSRDLGRTIYRMRCAIVHPNLDTQNSLTSQVLPALRAALIELTIARSAARFGVGLAEAQRQFDLAARATRATTHG